jgi:hypothetical protein
MDRDRATLREYIYTKERDCRAVFWEDAKAPNPRLDKDNLCVLETWDIVSASPDISTVHNLKAKLIHIMSSHEEGQYRAYWIDKRKVEHKKNDEYTTTLMMRILRAFGDSPFVTLLRKDNVGALHMTDQWVDGEIVGIGHVVPLRGRQSKEQLEDFMQEEIDKYNTWDRGDVWEYSVEVLSDCPCAGAHPGCAGSNWVQVVEGNGVYGKDVAIGEAATAWSEAEVV